MADFLEQQFIELLDFHADDFGISNNSTDDIIVLISKKYLNSISIMPNMTSFEYACQKFSDLKTSNIQKLPEVTIHLNFMEGHCCAATEDVYDLVDSKGFFKITWGDLFKWNYNPIESRKIKEQLKTEIIAQTKKCINAGIVKSDNLRFDGHQHTHMIPLVFKALLEAVSQLETEGFKTSFIRNTEDPILPYYKTKGIRATYNKINIIKCLILNHFSHYVKRQLIKRNLPVNYLCGVFFSGHMDSERLQKILPVYCKKALKQKRKIELLFHPGSVFQSEISEEFVKPDFNMFHLSPERKIEYNSIIKLHTDQD